MADIFVSYTSSDRDRAHWIAKELDALGHRPRLYEDEVKGGDSFYAWMRQRLDAADHALYEAKALGRNRVVVVTKPARSASAIARPG